MDSSSFGQVTLLVSVWNQCSLEPQPVWLTTMPPHGGTVFKSQGSCLLNHTLICLFHSISVDTALS